MKKLTKEEFIERSNKKHHSKYDYSRINYVNGTTKIVIICPEHGNFQMTPTKHMHAGCGCPECRYDRVRITCGNKKNWDFVQPEDYKLIPLTKGKFVKVDNEDFDKLKDENWCLSGSGYAKRVIYKSDRHTKHTVSMHIILKTPPEDMIILHKNKDKLDNRKSNLIIGDYNKMGASQSVRENKSSKYKGVSWNKQRSRWISQINSKGTRNILGAFDTEQQAAVVYNTKAKELFGEYATLNVIGD